MVEFHLEVDRKELAEAINRVSVSLPRKGDLEVRIEFQGGYMSLASAGASTQVAVEGLWPGFVRASLRALQRIKDKLPPSDPLPLRFSNGRLHIENWSVPGTWQDLGATPISLTIQPTLLDLLRVRAQEPAAKVVSSGLSSAVEGAVLKTRRLVGEAAGILSPLGITTADLMQLLDRKLTSLQDQPSPAANIPSATDEPE